MSVFSLIDSVIKILISDKKYHIEISAETLLLQYQWKNYTIFVIVLFWTFFWTF